ncbi:hypothetical protein M3Y95_01196200 [Aphelenchoides besseyi]|nr:hypothetical protein M3Y95_01196200 [Aphelenchoides besseyi]
MFGQRQLASWILVMSISVLVVTTGDPDCYKSENGFVKFDGRCTNTKTYTLSVNSNQLDIKFERNGNPKRPLKQVYFVIVSSTIYFSVNLNIGGCSFQVSFVVFENSGGFSYNNKDFTKATAQSDKITFNNEKVVTKTCSVNFETIEDDKYKVEVSIHPDNPEGFAITFENASFYSPVAKSVRDWVWILWSVLYSTLLLIFLVFSSVLGVAIVIVCVVISSILYCIFHKKDEKPQVVESYVAGSKQPLPAIVVTPSVKKESAKSKTSPGWAYAKNAEIARSTRQREIERRKSLPERRTLHDIRRSAHKKNSAIAMAKMKAAKSKRDNSGKKVAAAQAKQQTTKKLSDHLKDFLEGLKSSFKSKKQVSAEVAALVATTPQVKTKSLAPTQTDASTARDYSTCPTTRATTDVTTDFTTDATTEVTTTGARTTDDTRSAV